MCTYDEWNFHNAISPLKTTEEQARYSHVTPNRLHLLLSSIEVAVSFYYLTSLFTDLRYNN